MVSKRFDDGETTMTSVYHLDGENLRMTHYCGAGNQPRLKALLNELADEKITFQIVDVTNLSKPDAPHVIGAEIVFETQSNIILSFDFSSADKNRKEVIQLHKVE